MRARRRRARLRSLYYAHRSVDPILLPVPVRGVQARPSPRPLVRSIWTRYPPGGKCLRGDGGWGALLAGPPAHRRRRAIVRAWGARERVPTRS
eukprot:1225612-Pleurochrysis_carterae.AAC.1